MKQGGSDQQREKNQLLLEPEIYARCSEMDKVRNVEIKHCCMDYQNSIIDYFGSKQINWYGHVELIAKEGLPKRIFYWMSRV